MISGQQTLVSIDDALQGKRAAVAQIEQEVAGITAKLAEQQQGQIQDYQALARVRVDVLADDALSRHLDATEQQVSKLLARRREAADELDRQIATATAGIKALEQERGAQLGPARA
jgi:uncharacterized protein YhaN